MAPFADYEDMDDCKRAHSDKDDPGAYCAQIHKNATGEWPSEKAGGAESIAGRAVELLSSVLPGESGGDTALKVYVPDPSCVPPGPETQRDDGGWFYTETPGGLEKRGAPEGFVEVVPADEVLYPGVRRAAGVGSGAAAGKSWLPYEGPQGGIGWQNDEGDVRYTDEPPGDFIGPDEMRDLLGDTVVDDMLDGMSDAEQEAWRAGELPGGSGMPGPDDVVGVREPTAGEVRNTNASGVRVAETEGGEELYLKDADPGDAERVETSAAAAEALGAETPDRDYWDEYGAMAVEPVEGDSLLEAAGSADNPERTIAATLLAGETDPKPDNYVVRDDGTTVPVDMDQIGEASGGHLRSQATSFAQSVEFLEDFPFDTDDVLGEAEDIAAGVDTGELADRLPDTEAARRIIDNIESFRGGGAAGKGPWVPYAGPDGGRGWQDANDPDDVRYTDDPPGEPVNPDDIPPVEFARVAEGLDGDVDGGDVKDMLWDEYYDYTPDYGEGDTVAVETDDGRFEGEVTFHDGDFVDVETEDGRTVEAEAGDVIDVLEKDTPDAPWGGTKNRGSVDDDVTKEEIVEAIENTDALSEERKHQTIEEFERTLPPDGDWRDANDSVRDALDYAVVRPSKTGLTRNAAVHRITREAKRSETFSDNSAPDHLDPTRAEETETLGEAADVGTGITAEAMDVCEMPDGGRLFVTHTDSTLPRQTSGTPQASGEDAVAAVDAANALEAMGFPAPDHHYEHNRFLAVEEVDGEPITDRITDGFDAPPDERQVERCMAAQILVGNRDPHSGNVMMVTEEEDAGAGMGTVEQSKAVCFDLDLSGLDLTPGGSSGQTARYAIEKATKTVDKATGTGLMSTMDDEEMAKRVRDLARMVSIDDIRSAVKDEDMEETMVANIEAWRDYEEGDLY